MPEVPLPGAFEWTRYPWGPAIRCRPLAALADHCFTTRAPVFGSGPLTPGDGWHRVALSMGVSTRFIVRLRQVHGTRVVSVGRPERVSARRAGLERRRHRGQRPSGVALSVKVADCVPILIADARTGAVAAVHAGWRGTAAGAAESPSGARGALRVGARGPRGGHWAEHRPLLLPRRTGRARRVRGGRHVGRIAGRLVQPGPDRPGPARRARDRILPRPAAGRPLFLDTWTANADQLRGAGVPASQIHLSRVCTSCHRDTFHSYRVDGERAGRMIGVIRMR